MDNGRCHNGQLYSGTIGLGDYGDNDDDGYGDVKIYDDDTDVYVEEHSYDKHVEHGHDYVGDSDD